MDDLADEMLSDDFPPPEAATRPAALKAEKILSAIATSFPKNENDRESSPQQQPKKPAPRQTPVPKTPRLMPMPTSAQAQTPKQPRVASTTTAALKVEPPPSPLESVMRKANLKQTTLNWMTPARKRAMTPQQQQQPDQPRAESSSAAAVTSANSTPQGAPPPPRLKSILKQTKLQWPQGGYLFDIPRDYPKEHFKHGNKKLC